jgi:hypothetical protein
MALFEKGRQKTGGRIKGARNKLSGAFVEALAKDFEEHGEEAIRVARVERPTEYLKVIASIIPKEFEINDNRLMDLSDDELDRVIEFVRAHLSGFAGEADSREEPSLQ